MTLFDNLETTIEFNSEYSGKTITSKSKIKSQYAFIDRLKNASEDIPEIKQGEQVICISCENFGATELLVMLSNRIGAKEISLTTWSINELFISEISKMLENGVAIRFSCDKSLRGRKSHLWAQLAELSYKYKGKLTVKMHDLLHAKVMTIESETDHITIEGSANFSKNTRIEQFIITNDIERVNFHKSWMSKI